MEHSSPKQSMNLTKMLIALIAVLTVILIVVICIAVNTHDGQGDKPSGGSTGETSTIMGGTSGESGLVLHVEDVNHSAEAGFTLDSEAVFSGTADPGQALTVNGQSVRVEQDGSFTCKVPLNPGKNEIVFSHKGEQQRFEIFRRQVVQSYSPEKAETFGSGATIRFQVFAKADSQVSVAFNGKQIVLSKADNQQGTGAADGFSLFAGEYKLPNTNTGDLDLGVITYTAVSGGVTETYTSGRIICEKAPDILASSPVVTPSYGDYIDVGSGYIAEIVSYAAETFDGDTTDDYSHPTNAYLPKGTVDYCSTTLVEKGQLKYVLLRCGRRVYVDKKNQPSSERTQVTDRYAGKLPDHNEIGFASMDIVENHTVLTLDCLWKAPFYFDILPQRYAYPDAGANRSYEITAFTATHIDITFCYATKFSGTVQIPEGNTPFQSAELIQNESDCTLRLYLKKTGGFYGWDCYYNSKDQLCFQFLNPAKAIPADNAFGADLTGVTVMIDVGHGGVDGGATGEDAEGNRWSESGRNMDLAYALRDRLQSIGATVVFNREGKVTLTTDERIMILKDAAPDFCIAIHHNSIGGHPEINGFETYYYTPFSQLATEQIYLQTKQTDAYKSAYRSWHNYYVARQTVCPVVLTENGYMSSQFDLANTLSDTVIAKKADAMAQGIADYFLKINE